MNSFAGNPDKKICSKKIVFYPFRSKGPQYFAFKKSSFPYGDIAHPLREVYHSKKYHSRTAPYGKIMPMLYRLTAGT